MNRQKLRTIAECQLETGIRVEYPPAVILGLLNDADAADRRLEFVLRHFCNGAVWSAESIDSAMEARRQKGIE
jgi:hypothetical protein